jgi:SAM-dependent methyltransferase
VVSGSETGAGPADEPAAAAFDPTVASSARIYDYWLGGKDNFAADREAAEQAIAANPGIVADVRANRGFLARAVRFLARDGAIRQFLDIGTGLPTASNTHQVAQEVAPSSRIVYVDNDPVVLAHAKALLTSTPEGATAYLDHDLRDVGPILEGASATLDLTQPVAVMLLIVLHLIPDAQQPHVLVTQLMDRLAPGSYLVISHPASDIRPAAMAEMARRVNARLGPAKGTMRDRADIARFFDGLTLLEPGVVQPQQWRPESGLSPAEVTAWCGVARKNRDYSHEGP